MDSLESKIIETLSGVLGLPTSAINMDSNMQNTGCWDSQAAVGFIVALEEAFDIEIDIDDAEKFTSIKTVYDTLKNYEL